MLASYLAARLLGTARHEDVRDFRHFVEFRSTREEGVGYLRAVRTLLAALDFSPVSDAVVAQAASLAEAFSAELTLVHVAAPEPEFVGYEAGPQSVRTDRAREVRGEHRDLQATAEGLRGRGIRAHALLIQGPVVEKILAEAERLGADAIVIGSHGHGALHRLLLGSVSEGVVRAARCPVVLVPAARAADSSAGSGP